MFLRLSLSLAVGGEQKPPLSLLGFRGVGVSKEQKERRRKRERERETIPTERRQPNRQAGKPHVAYCIKTSCTRKLQRALEHGAGASEPSP